MRKNEFLLGSASDLAAVISRCVKTKNLKLGRQIHSHLLKTALNLTTFFSNRLIEIYSKCNSVDVAQKVFDDLPVKNARSWNGIISAYSKIGSFGKARQLLDAMPEPNLVSYNTILSSLTRRGLFKEAINMFKRMQLGIGRDGFWMDEYTVVILVNACAVFSVLKLLRQIHGRAIMNGLMLNVVVFNAMIDAYGKCCEPEVSGMIFSRMEERDVVTWTSLVVAYSQASRLVDACRVFNEMPLRNVVSWTALITGFVKIGQGNEALNLFAQMLEDNVVPSAFTYASVLSACADLALIERGKQVHSLIIRNDRVNDLQNVYVVNALVDMYCKCGDMRSAMALFEGFDCKDLITWNSIITGFAQNGQAELSLALFEEMMVRKIKPSHVTFLGVLASCSHTGRVYEGLQILDRMEKDFGVTPQLDHYAIFIDLLGRKNQLREALEKIENSSCSDHIGMWGALLNACSIHGNTVLGRRAAGMLFELEPKNAARYVMLSNIYTAAGLWNEAHRVRRLMDEQGLRKEAAHSWIEVRNTRHEFVSKDMLHRHITEIRDLLHKLGDNMKDVGYLPVDELFLDEDDRLT